MILFATHTSAQERRDFKIKSDTGMILQDSTVLFWGNVVYAYNADTIYADSLSLEHNTHNVTATGNVRVKTGTGLSIQAGSLKLESPY